MVMKEWIHQSLQGQPPEAIGGPVPMSEIKAAERELGVTLPDDYKEFIHFYGSAGLPSYQILGLREAPFAYLTRETFVQVTKKLREEFPDDYKHMVVITTDEYDVIGFLPNSTELLLINWESDYQEKVHVANSFEEFV